jgi:hypothetical protein
LPPLQAVQDDEAGPALRDCCALLGCFAQPEQLLEALLPRLEDAAAEPRALAAALEVLAGLLQGAALSGALAPHLGPLLALLLSAGLVKSEDVHVGAAVGRVAEQAVASCCPGAEEQGGEGPAAAVVDEGAVQQLLLVLLYLQRLGGNGGGGSASCSKLPDSARLVGQLAAARGCEPQQLLAAHGPALLDSLLRQHGISDGAACAGTGSSSCALPSREVQVMCQLLVPLSAWGYLCCGQLLDAAACQGPAAAASQPCVCAQADSGTQGASSSLLQLLDHVLLPTAATSSERQQQQQLLTLRAVYACLTHWPPGAWSRAALRRLLETHLPNQLQGPAAAASAPMAAAAMACLDAATGAWRRSTGQTWAEAGCAQGLVQGLQHSCAAVRRQACGVLARNNVGALGGAEGGQRLQVLSARLDDSDAGVRAAALAGLVAVAQAAQAAAGSGGSREGGPGSCGGSCGEAAGRREMVVQELRARAKRCADDAHSQHELELALEELGSRV